MHTCTASKIFHPRYQWESDNEHFFWLLPLSAPSFEVYTVPAEEFVAVQRCVFWYESSFTALAFGVADNNWLAGVAFSISVQREQPMPTAHIFVAYMVKKKKKKSQLRWLRHLIEMPPGCLPLEFLWASWAGRRPRGRCRTCWRDYIAHLVWECLWPGPG